VTHKNQIIGIFLLATILGLIRFIFINDPEFTLIKKERIVQQISSYVVPDDMTEPMSVDLEFAKHHFDNSSAIFIDAREVEDFELGHIKDAINIPYDYYEEYENIIDELDDMAIYIIYCSGGECSLSLDLADYLFNEKVFEKVLIFEGGWPEWRDAGYPY
jgi:rhodanese-related sulfurtransferase